MYCSAATPALLSAAMEATSLVSADASAAASTTSGETAGSAAVSSAARVLSQRACTSSAAHAGGIRPPRSGGAR
jgi:hypothetical protein